MVLVGGGGSPSSIYIVNGTFLGVTWVLVAARCYVRHFLLRAFSKEDWLAIISLVRFLENADCYRLLSFTTRLDLL